MLVREWYQELIDWCEVPRSLAIVGAKNSPDPHTAGVTLCSYDRAARPEVFDMLRRRRNAQVICDEAHYLKGPEAKRSIAVLGDHITRGLASDAGQVSFLTGTPCPNNAGELFQMLRTAGRFDGTHHDFLLQFCKTRMTPYGLRVTGYKDAAGIRQMLEGFMLRRTNAVVLPPSTAGEIVLEPDAAADPEALATVRNVDPKVALMIKQAARLGNFDTIDTPHLATLRRAVGLAKAHATAKAAAELLTKDPAAKLVLFGIHRDVLVILFKQLENFSPIILAGGIPDKKRKASKDRFQSDYSCRVAICQMKAAGTGLTLTAANHLWIVEPSWSPAENEQARRRILRIGQKRETFINLITLANSIDTATAGVLLSKQQLIDEIYK
jgi:SNF2 family DNA or RNA helicase